jgi:amino acid permease
MYINGKVEEGWKKLSDNIIQESDKYPRIKKIKDEYVKYTKEITIIIIISCAIFAGYLAWQCSSFKGSNILSRIFKVFVAMLLNIFYIIYYYLTKSDICFIMKRLDEIDVTKSKRK